MAQPYSLSRCIRSSCRLLNSFSFVACDFDETISVADTTPDIFQLAVQSKPISAQSEFACRCACFSEQYFASYNRVLSKTLELLATDCPLLPLNVEQLATHLNPIHSFIKEQVELLENADLLSGISMKSLLQVGSQVPLRPFALSTLHSLALHTPLYIVSVGWSRDLIESSVTNRVQEDNTSLSLWEDTPQESHQISDRIFSSQLEFRCDANNLKSSNAFSIPLHSPLDKLHTFRSMRTKHDKPTNNIKNTGLSLFIGDSVTDILCLLEADIGIIMGQASSLKDMLGCLGLSPSHIFNCVNSSPQRDSLFTKGLFHASSWKEVSSTFAC